VGDGAEGDGGGKGLPGAWGCAGGRGEWPRPKRTAVGNREEGDPCAVRRERTGEARAVGRRPGTWIRREHVPRGERGEGGGTLLAWGRYQGGWRRGRGALCVVGGRRRSSRSDSRSTRKKGRHGPNKGARRGHREKEERGDNNQPRRRRGNVLQSVVVGRNDATAPKIDELRPTEAAVGVRRSRYARKTKIRSCRPPT